MKASRTNPLNIWEEFNSQQNQKFHKKKNSNKYISDQGLTENGSMKFMDKPSPSIKTLLQSNGQVIMSCHKYDRQIGGVVKPGYWTKKFTDKPYLPGNRGRFYFSINRFINTQCRELGFGRCEKYKVMLRSFDLTMTNTRTGASEYVCPSDFKAEVIDARLNATKIRIDCQFNISIEAEESHGNKYMKDPIEYAFKVYFTVVGHHVDPIKEHIEKPVTLRDNKRVKKELLYAY